MVPQLKENMLHEGFAELKQENKNKNYCVTLIEEWTGMVRYQWWRDSRKFLV